MRWLPVALLSMLLAACGAAPVSAPSATADTGAQAAARRNVLDFETPAFQRYNQALDKTICDLSAGTIIPGGMLTGVTNPEAFAERLNRQIYAPLFEDPALLAQSRTTANEWANSVSQYQQDQRTAWEHIAQGLSPQNEREQRVSAIYRSRKARWQRLGKRVGMPVPMAFHLYRGVKGDFMAESVLKAWKDERSDTFRIPLYTLSSWSLSEQTAIEFQAAWGSPDVWIVFEADVPFEKTLMDKWVDGGTFAERYPGQHEVVVATREPDEIVIPDVQATVWLDRKRYTYQDRAAFIQAWEARLVAK